MYFSSSLLFPFSVLILDPSASAAFKSLNRITSLRSGQWGWAPVSKDLLISLLSFFNFFFSRGSRCYEEISLAVCHLSCDRKKTPLWPQVIQMAWININNHRKIPTIILPTTTATTTITIMMRRPAAALAPPSLGTMNRQATPLTFRKPRMPLSRLSSDGG